MRLYTYPYSKAFSPPMPMVEVGLSRPGMLAKVQRIEQLLQEWIQTPDWDTSEAFLNEHQDELLSDEAEAALLALLAASEQHPVIAQHLALLHRGRQVGVAQAYQELHQAAGDPANIAMAALLQVDSAETLAQAIKDHPTLLELPTLERLAELVEQTQADDTRQTSVQLLALLVALLEAYNYRHAEEIEPQIQAQFIALHERLLPLITDLDIEELAAGLRRSAGWACNALGNHYADTVKDLEQAIAAYGRGLAFDPSNAMLLRNRAGVHLDRRDLAAARADIEATAALEPDAPRLADLRAALQQAADR